jgi:inhibitor of KinA
MNIKSVSVDSIIIYFEKDIDEKTLDKLLYISKSLKSLEHIIDIVPSYNSILVHYDILFYNYNSIKQVIEDHLKNTKQEKKQKYLKTIEVEVDYSKGLDLNRVAQYNNLTIDEIINIHQSTIYRVYAIGFIVGFAYMANVDKRISTPRLDTPRSKVQKGSVAIADNQTAVYPMDSAGGWNIIGVTDFNKFESFEVGDSVRFVSI